MKKVTNKTLRQLADLARRKPSLSVPHATAEEVSDLSQNTAEANVLQNVEARESAESTVLEFY